MSLDIGEAFGEGFSRTFARNGLLLAAAFVVVALVTVVLSQTLMVGLLETMLESFQGLSPQELNVDQGEYEQLLTDLETQLETARESSPLALGFPVGVAAGGLLAVALVAEAVSIVAVRVFAADAPDAPGDVTDGLLLATLNGFVGGVVVWGLIVVGSALLLLPGLFFAVAFYFLRQEIALKDKNFVQAMADSWRLTKGHRIGVFALGVVVAILTQASGLVGSAVGFLSMIGGQVVAAVLGGLLAAFGAAVVTRAYVQLDDGLDAVAESEPDPYDAALGPDDIPKEPK
jgi:hypothetical protein